MEMKTLLSLLVFLAGLTLGVQQAPIGNCPSQQYYTATQRCQRVHMEELALNRFWKDTNDKQDTCIDKEFDTCTKGTAFADASMRDQIIPLVKASMFQYGNESVNTNDIRSILILLGCNTQDALAMFARLHTCWRDLADRVKANAANNRPNSNDPELCRLYKEGKDCVANETHAHCPAVHVPRDNCNPFCTNNTDNNQTCNALVPEFKCNTSSERADIYKKIHACAKKKLIDKVTKSGMSNPCSARESPSDGTPLEDYEHCVDKELDACYKPIRDPVQFEALKDAVIHVSCVKRFFCSASPYNITGKSNLVKGFMPGCSNTFFNAAETCGTKMRVKFLANKKDRELCSTYKEATGCCKKALDNCNFDEKTKDAFKDDAVDNPFDCSGTILRPFIWISALSLFLYLFLMTLV